MTALDINLVLTAARDAHGALASAMTIVEQKQTDLSTRMAASKTALDAAKDIADQLEADVKKPAVDHDALQRQAALANERSAAALKSTADLIGAVGFIGTVGSPIDEWKECRSTIDRFDKIHVDLRKTGFGFVTAIAAGAQFLFTDSNSFAAKAALLAMLILLIITLYWIDLAHQQWLEVAVERAKTIERDRFCGSISLTTEIGEKFKPVRAMTLGLILYLTLLLATCSVFFFSAPKNEPLTSGHHGFVEFAFLVGMLTMIGGWIFSDDQRRFRPIIAGYSIQAVFVGVVILIAAAFLVVYLLGLLKL
jgi:hypothetical protein